MRTYIPKYLDKEVYKRVLSVARSYEDNKRRIKSIEFDRIYSTPDCTVHGSGISKPVQSVTEQIEKSIPLCFKSGFLLLTERLRYFLITSSALLCRMSAEALL